MMKYFKKSINIKKAVFPLYDRWIGKIQGIQKISAILTNVGSGRLSVRIPYLVVKTGSNSSTAKFSTIGASVTGPLR